MKNMVVDCAYTCAQYPNNIIIETNGEFYAIPSMGRTTNELSAFKKLDKKVVENLTLRELPNYRYPSKELEKKGEIKISVGRAISRSELADLKSELGLSDDDISEPYETTRGSVYGAKSEKRFSCVQIKVREADACGIEHKLKVKGIEAGNINAGIIEIRIPECTLKEFRAKTSMSQSQFASHFGLSVRNVQEWEQGKKNEPPYLINLLQRIWELENA